MPGWGATLGRSLTFVALFAVASWAAAGLLSAPLTWLAGRTGQHLRIDGYVALAGALAATAIMLRAIDVRPWGDVGLARGAARLGPLAAGWCVGGGAIAAASLVMLGTGLLRVVPGTEGSWLGAAARVTIFLAPAALVEEVMCRGYLFTALRDRLGTRGAVLATSALFGVLHAMNPGAGVESMLIVTLAGVFLAAVRVAYDSLYAAWSAHLAWNWMMAVPLHAPVSGLQLEHPGYRVVSAGPEWITGGTWGPEGGLVAALGMMGGLAYLYTRRRREES